MIKSLMLGLQNFIIHDAGLGAVSFTGNMYDSVKSQLKIVYLWYFLNGNDSNR